MRPAGFIHYPSLAIIVSTFSWGTWWIPLRQLDEIGQSSIWFTGLGVALPALFFLPHALRFRKRIVLGGWPLAICSISFGITCACYAEGAMRGNVARVILLFYLTPVWSTLLARLILNQPITGKRLMTILLGFMGLWIILGSDGVVPMPQNAAEGMGLIAGLFWAISAVYIQLTRNIKIKDAAFPVFTSIAVCFLLLTLIPGGRNWELDTLTVLPSASLWILAIALIWQMPAILLTLYGARFVEPGRLAILLMLEVVIGVGSAAILTNEPFGTRELAGMIFIMAAGICEFVRVPHLKLFG